MNIRTTFMALMLCVPFVANAAQQEQSMQPKTKTMLQQAAPFVLGAATGIAVGTGTFRLLNRHPKLLGIVSRDLTKSRNDLYSFHWNRPISEQGMVLETCEKELKNLQKNYVLKLPLPGCSNAKLQFSFLPNNAVSRVLYNKKSCGILNDTNKLEAIRQTIHDFTPSEKIQRMREKGSYIIDRYGRHGQMLERAEKDPAPLVEWYYEEQESFINAQQRFNNAKMILAFGAGAATAAVVANGVSK